MPTFCASTIESKSKQASIINKSQARNTSGQAALPSPGQAEGLALIHLNLTRLIALPSAR